jgi:hypothetical protein
MRVFISYSFQDEELYLLSLLIDKLQKQGHQVRTTDFLIENNRFYLNNSDLFIGIITVHSDDIQSVLSDCKHAKQLHKKSILLVEKGVYVNEPSMNIIRFDRKNPAQVINKLLGIKPKKQLKRNSILEDGIVIGGIIVGVAALISLLSEQNKQ